MSLIRLGRGQPLIALVAVLGGWIGGRAASWSPPALLPEAVALQTPAPPAEPRQPLGYRADPGRGLQSQPAEGQSPADDGAAGYGPAGYGAPAYGPGGYGAPGYGPAGYAPIAYAPPGYVPGYAIPPGYALLPVSALARLVERPQRIALVAAASAPPQSASAPPRSTAMAGQSMPSLAQPMPTVARSKSSTGGGWDLLSQLFRLPSGSRDAFAANGDALGMFAPENPRGSATPQAAPGVVPASSPAAPAVSAGPRRWSADAWALLRHDTTDSRLSPGAMPASYGASQAGAVLRYRLSIRDPHQPAFYLRTTSSMGQSRQSSAAAGLSARPFGGVPVVAAVEARLTEQSGVRSVQPVAMAVTELPPFKLPGQLRGEAYLQGGYVAGKYATPFADGQLRVDRRVWSKGRVDTRLGVGVWGGGQKGAARLDVGPTASLAMPLGRGVYGRAAVDWRLRMAGDAEPGSGPALTLSAGF
ncbi:hypothetical protein WSK_2647 [Novosphingobium sp. Rr 2-17]|uniref:hypothetical protein n=1 Tax=Novosphingobium sp. Rr 2-17 TaxID=555793 RepID=UPI00026988A3|nr:hypothetical protein [Novosphingobium sp. Rr 2-17]EIZ78599.1 hypothetical protein WSK_2647 [Novosphingobium sp. Rr 2-17]